MLFYSTKSLILRCCIRKQSWHVICKSYLSNYFFLVYLVTPQIFGCASKSYLLTYLHPKQVNALQEDEDWRLLKRTMKSILLNLF